MKEKLNKRISILQKNVYKCNKCDKIYDTKETAISCCKNMKCKRCGIKLEKDSNPYLISASCDSCLEELQIERATKITYREYLEKHSGQHLSDRNVDYLFENLGEAKYHYLENEDSLPKFLYLCEEIFLHLDAETIVENASDGLDNELASRVNTSSLQIVLNSWLENNRESSFCQTDIVVLISEDDWEREGTTLEI